MDIELGDDVYIWNKPNNPIPMDKVVYLGNLYEDGRNLCRYRNINDIEVPEIYFDKDGNSSVGNYEVPYNSALSLKQHIWVANNYPLLQRNQLSKIYSLAYDMGHSDGEYEVNLYFENLCRFAESLLRDGLT